MLIRDLPEMAPHLMFGLVLLPSKKAIKKTIIQWAAVLGLTITRNLRMSLIALTNLSESNK
jgi:hypothetical protein